jgi:hypothetical protein
MVTSSYSRQVIITMPTNSSACAKSGNAVTATSRSTPSRLVTRNCLCAARRWSRAILAGRLSTGNGFSESSASRGAKLAMNSSSDSSPASAKVVPIASSAASL